MATLNRDNTIVLFDVDGTLSLSRQKASPEMLDTLKKLRSKVCTGIVGGSNLKKIEEQLGDSATTDHDFVFAENGVTCFREGKPYSEWSTIESFLGGQRYKELLTFLKEYIDGLNIPVKTSEFVEPRTGMVNASPIGRACSQQQRDEFYAYDQVHKVREAMIAVLEQKFEGWNLKYSIGGQISIDIFPIGWDKTYCLRYLKNYSNIYFFGDKTEPGGNDYEIFIAPGVHAKSVKNPTETLKFITEMFLS